MQIQESLTIKGEGDKNNAFLSPNKRAYRKKRRKKKKKKRKKEEQSKGMEFEYGIFQYGIVWKF